MYSKLYADYKKKYTSKINNQIGGQIGGDIGTFHTITGKKLIFRPFGYEGSGLLKIDNTHEIPIKNHKAVKGGIVWIFISESGSVYITSDDAKFIADGNKYTFN